MTLLDRRGVRALSVAACAVALGAAAAAPALAATGGNAEGYWYYDVMGYEDLHASGIDGSGVTIAVIDSAINPDVSSLAGANLEVQEPGICQDADGAAIPATSTDVEAADHGTNVAGYLVGNGDGGPQGVAPGARVLYYSVTGDLVADPDSDYGLCGDTSGRRDAAASHTVAIEQAVAAGADIISISIGDDDAAGDADIQAIIDAMQAGIIVVASVPNFESASEFFVTYPAGFNGVVAVGAIDANGNPMLSDFNSTGEVIGIDVRAPGVELIAQGIDGDWGSTYLAQGNSYATPLVAGTFALGLQAHPEATANQLIQAMMRTTFGNEQQELNLDPASIVGYGIMDPAAFVALDPLTLPDENPLLTDDADAEPTRAQVLAGSETGASTEPEVTAQPTSEPASSDEPAAQEDQGGGLSPLIIVGAVVVLAGTVTAIVIAVRATKKERIDVDQQ